MATGLLVSLEGIDGCGKSTQAELIKEKLSSKGIDHLSVREPGGTVAGEEIRSILLGKDRISSLQAELMLYMAARSELVRQVIRPALQRGAIVICDRFADSTVAYQGYGGGMSIKTIKSLNNIATGGLKPQLTLLFDLSVEKAAARRGGRRDRMEEKDDYFHARVRSGFLQIAAAEPGRFKVIDASAGVEIQHQAVWSLLESIVLPRC